MVHNNAINLKALEEKVEELGRLTQRKLQLDKNISGYTIDEVSNEHGGVKRFTYGRYTKGQLADMIDLYTKAYCDALDDMKKEKTRRVEHVST